MRTLTSSAAAMLLVISGGCAVSQNGTTATRGDAVAMLRTAAGVDVGRAVARAEGTRIRITIDGKAMPAGVHGAHVHTTGRCDAPDFASAGPHWNPTGAQHGTQNPAGAHAGDLPNLTVAADGSGSLSMLLPAGTLDAMLDEDGAAMVIHAAADDLRTDPSGNSGGRIACGVFAAR
jgi:Cu-Zn family superoxide dismutase